MNITIKAKNLDLTPSIKDYINDKIGSLSKLLSQFETQGDVLCEVEIARTSNHHNKGDVFYAEINLRLPNKMLRAEDEDFDIRVAIDRVRDRMQHDLIKYKEKGGFTGKALRHMGRLGSSAAKAASKILWWRNK